MVYTPHVSIKKWIENPKKIEPMAILITDNRTDFSLPYLVYTTNTVRAINPITRNNQAKTHKVNEGTSAIYRRPIFIYPVFLSYDLYFFNFIDE